MPAPGIASLLRERAASASRDRVAIRFYENGDWLTWSWSALWLMALAAASGLAASGVARGDRVMMIVPEARPAVTALFGLWALGAVPIPVGLPFALGDLADFLDRQASAARELGAMTLLLSPIFAGEAARDGDGIRRLLVDRVLEAGAGRLIWDVTPGDGEAAALAYIQMTSGSTGRPRAIAVPQDRLFRHLEAMSAALPQQRDAVGLSWLPLHHDMGLVGGLLFPFHNGFPAHMIATAEFRRRPWIWIEAVSRFRVTICAAPPSAYAICAPLGPRAKRAGLDLAAWEYALVGAEPIAAGVLRGFAEAFAPCGFRAEALLPVYGLAEATLAVTFSQPSTPARIEAVDRRSLADHGLALPSSAPDAVAFVGVGRPIPGTQLRIADDEGTPLPERRIGEVLVQSPTLMDTYVGGARSGAPLREGWLRTGDLGYVADGDLFITGRSKDLIIQGGQKLFPAVLEEIVAGVDGVRAGAAAAVGVPSPERKTEAVCIVAETRLPAAEQPLLAARIRAALGAHGVPLDRVVLIPPHSLPRTTSGKLRRPLLAQALAGGAEMVALGDGE